jgi:ABC-type Co2+ transport system permease subunit
MIFDVREILVRIVKYIVEGLMVAIAAFVIPKPGHALKLDEIALIGLSAAATFSLLDMVAPSIGSTARSGAGFGIGANLVGFPGGF